MSGAVQTVLGPVAAAELGPTSPHEHLLVDLSCWFDEPADEHAEQLASERVGPGIMAMVRENPFAIRDNLVLDDEDAAATELAIFRLAGGRTVVDLTLDEIGRDPAGLARLARRSGLNVVMGCGHYIARAQPADVRSAGVPDLADEMVGDLVEGIDGIRAGAIGEIGTSDPIDPSEARVLEAACRAQRETGVALYVHLDPWGRAGYEALDLCERFGADLGRVVLCHLDPTLDDPAYVRGLAARGAWVGIDIWGDEDAYGGRGMPSDAQRVDAVLRAHDEGWSRRLLLAQDVCLKSQLRAHGGRGYDHILTSVAPMLRDAGLSAADVRALVVDNPARLLTGEAPAHADDASGAVAPAQGDNVGTEGRPANRSGADDEQGWQR